MSKQVNYNENLCAGAAIRDDKGRRISKLFEASHPKMTVGYAKNLIMPDDPTEQEFNFRQSGGGVIEDGVAVIDKVKGRSVVWNQQNNNSDARTKTYNGITYTFNSNKTKCTITGTSTARSNIAIKSGFSVVEGHKYFVGGIPSVASASTCRLCINEGSESQGYIRSNFFIASSIYTVPSGTTKLTLEIVGAEVANYSPSSVVFQPVLIDLTQMFGAGNEPATYEDFLQRKPTVVDEYAYNEGEIINNKVEAIKTSGVNLWDEQWELGSLNAQGLPAETTASIRSKEFNRCLPNCEICFSCQSAAAKLIYWYDVNKAFISRYEIPNSASIYGVTTSPANAYFFKVRNDKSTYNHDICINLSDPTINGQYFPYEEHTLDLSWVKDIKDAEGVKLFEDGMRSAGTAFDEVRKNKAVKRIGVVNLGNLNWEPGVQTGQYKASDFKQLRPSAHKSLVCANYTTREDGGNMQDDSKDLWVWNNVGGGSGYYPDVLVAKDTRYSSAQAFKQAVQGVPLYYELAEPIEVEYDEKSLTYPVVAGGTEEAIASEPSTAFRADIGYGIDAVKTILDLKARVEALEGK